MNYRQLYSVGLFLFMPMWCVAQVATHAQKDTVACHLKLAYNSSLVYPGARAGVEYPIRQKVVLQKDTDIVRYTRVQLLSVNLGWYHHPYFHDNIYLTLGYTWRKVHASGYFTEVSPELGYSRTFLGATTYQVDDYGNVSIHRWAGYSYALASFGGGWGYDFSVKKHLPFAVFGKLNMLCMFPYNSTFYLRPAAEIGFIYTPRHLLRHVIHTKYVR
jgi:hypothetical protein